MKTTKLIILTLLALVMPIDVVAELVIKDEQGVEYSLSDREATVVGYAAPEGAEEGMVDITIPKYRWPELSCQGYCSRRFQGQ